MNNFSSLKIRALVLLMLVGTILLTTGISFYETQTRAGTSHLAVHFLDVGQGDAIFIETPEQVQVLIDGGPDGSVLRQLGEVMRPFDKTIDLVLATHSDKDHVGGLIDVLTRYQVSAIMRTSNLPTTSVARQFTTQAEKEKATLITPLPGERYIVGASTTLTVFSPAGDVSNHESNASSLVVKIEYGDTAFFLTGDAPIGIEEYLAQVYSAELPSTVLKLGHHGSRTSTSEIFLAKVAPDFVVVSAGKDNSYGHPHAEVISKVEAVGSQILSTAISGRVTFYSDGERMWLENK